VYTIKRFLCRGLVYLIPPLSPTLYKLFEATCISNSLGIT